MIYPKRHPRYMPKWKAWIIVIISAIWIFLVMIGGLWLLIKFIKFAWGA